MEFRNCEEYVLARLSQLEDENAELKEKLANVSDYARDDSQNMNEKLNDQSEYVEHLENVLRRVLQKAYFSQSRGLVVIPKTMLLTSKRSDVENEIINNIVSNIEYARGNED